MLRIKIDDERDRFYTLAYLSTPTAQSLLTRSRTGVVIDHLAPAEVAAVEVPLLDSAMIDAVAESMSLAIRLREQARRSLAAEIDTFESLLPQVTRSRPLHDGWTMDASELRGRLDAANYDPVVAEIRRLLLEQNGVRVKDVADAFMLNRYKRVYVDAEYGRCIVSGRQLLQTRPVNLQYIAAGSLDFNKYALGENTIAFERVGEQKIGSPNLL